MHGNYQFSVVAFTSQGQGEAASLMLDTLPRKLITIIIS